MSAGILIDTNVAIHLRDRNMRVIARLAELDAPPLPSIITRVELEAGVAARPDDAERLCQGNDALHGQLEMLGFDVADADACAAIVRHTGHSRRRTLDRLVAATAIVHRLTLVTINGDDFRDIPDLSLDIWPAQ